VWSYESKRPGRSSTFPPKTIPMRDTWFSSFESWPIFGYNTCPGRSHAAVVATVYTAWQDGGLPRDPGASQGDRIAWTVSEGRRWYATADRRGPVKPWATRGDQDLA